MADDDDVMNVVGPLGLLDLVGMPPAEDVDQFAGHFPALGAHAHAASASQGRRACLALFRPPAPAGPQAQGPLALSFPYHMFRSLSRVGAHCAQCAHSSR